MKRQGQYQLQREAQQTVFKLYSDALSDPYDTPFLITHLDADVCLTMCGATYTSCADGRLPVHWLRMQQPAQGCLHTATRPPVLPNNALAPPPP